VLRKRFHRDGATEQATVAHLLRESGRVTVVARGATQDLSEVDSGDRRSLGDRICDELGTWLVM
jgi:hypothetical protein